MTTLMDLRRRLRLWNAGKSIGQWRVHPPCYVRYEGRYQMCARRVLPSGDYQYRPLTEAEEFEHLQITAW